MRELKKPLSFNEQLEQLKSHGMLIDDEEKALEVLRRVNYYRFTGYALHYRKGPHDSDYVDGTTFEMVYRIYQFDEAMRNLLKRYIETAEVYYRTQISYGFCMAKCTPPPHDQHYDEDNFFNKKGYQEIRKSFSRERDRYKDSLIVKHHVSEFGGKMPLWVVVDLLSFSNLSKLYSTMYITEKEDIAAAVGTGRKTLTNHLHCISVLRSPYAPPNSPWNFNGSKDFYFALSKFCPNPIWT